MEDIWNRVEKAIRALGASGSFAPPANDTSILAAESLLGTSLPEQLRSSLGVHNGDAMKKLASGGWQSDGPFAHLEWLSLGAIVSEWETWRDTISAGGLEPQPEGPVKPLWWSPKWVPFTVIGGSTWHHCIDLDPAPGGKIGQVIEIADDDGWRRVVAPSLRAFLVRVADDLESGRYGLDDEGKLVHESWR